MPTYFSCDKCDHIPALRMVSWTRQSAEYMQYDPLIINAYNYNVHRPREYDPTKPETKLLLPSLLYFCEDHRDATNNRSIFPTDTLKSLSIPENEFPTPADWKKWKASKKTKRSAQIKRKSCLKHSPRTRALSVTFNLDQHVDKQEELLEIQLKRLQELKITKLQLEMDLFKQEKNQYEEKQQMNHHSETLISLSLCA
jgi:hypothetical protein